MLSKLSITFDLNHLGKVNYNISSKFHGMLIENLEKEYADKMHQEGLKPYSQNISLNGDTLDWNIFALNDEAYENILLRIYSKQSFYLAAINKEIFPQKTILEKVNKQDVFNKNFSNEASRLITINFKTVTAFKSNNRYINYPDIKLIFQSIMNKYDAFMDDKVMSDDILNQFNDCVFIKSFNVRSANLKVDHVSIPGFIGQINFYIKGPQQMVNLINYLIDFAEFSGIGIKTSLGMGKVEKG